MPLREYVCQDCGKRHETLVRTIEDVIVRCPDCGSEKIEQVISTYGGYQGNLGSSSTRPRGAGSFKRRK